MTPDRLAQAREYAAKLRAHRGICQCCGGLIAKAAMDHNHRTGKLRALVCYPCNAKIGYVEWIIGHPEETERIRSYLTKHDPHHELAYKDEHNS